MTPDMLQSLLATVPQEAPKKQRRGAVMDGVIQFLSVSQMQKAQRCMLQWWFRYVQRIKEEAFKAALVGIKLHEEAAHYLSTGEDVLGPILRAGKHLMPLPGADLLVEERFDGQKNQKAEGQEMVEFRPETATLRVRGIPVDGFMDWVSGRALLQPWRAYPDGEVDPAGTLEIGDHKSTGDVDEKASTPEQLSSANTEFGLQMITYGQWAIQNAHRFPNLQRVRLTHIYYQTKGRRYARRESGVVTLDQIRSEWETVNQLVDGMIVAAKETDPKRVPFDLSACRWCRHQAICPAQQNLDPRQALFQAFGLAPTAPNLFDLPPPKGSNPEMSLIDDVMQTPAAPAAPPPTDPAAARAQQLAALQAQIAALQAQPAPQPAAPQLPPPPPPPPAPPPLTPMQPVASAQPHPTVAAVLPPDAPKSDPAKAAEPFPAPTGDVAATGRDATGAPIPGQLYKLPTGHVARFLCASNGQNVFTIDGHPQPVALPPNAPLEFIPSAPPAAPASPAAPAAEKPKRTKKPKEEQPAAAAVQATAPAPTAPPTQPVATIVAQPNAPGAAITAAAASIAQASGGDVEVTLAEPKRFRLFIGCRPDAGAQRLDDYVHKLERQIATRFNVVNIQLAPNKLPDGKDHPLGYGRWEGVLRALCREQPPAPGDYFCSLEDTLARIVALELATVAKPEDVTRAL